MTKKSFEEVNAARPAQMLKVLDTIEKSAYSNRAEHDRVKAILEPVLDRLEVYQTGPVLSDGDTAVSTPDGGFLKLDFENIDPRRFPMFVRGLDDDALLSLSVAVSTVAMDRVHDHAQTSEADTDEDVEDLI